MAVLPERTLITTASQLGGMSITVNGVTLYPGERLVVLVATSAGLGVVGALPSSGTFAGANLPIISTDGTSDINTLEAILDSGVVTKQTTGSVVINSATNPPSCWAIIVTKYSPSDGASVNGGFSGGGAEFTTQYNYSVSTASVLIACLATDMLASNPAATFSLPLVAGARVSVTDGVSPLSLQEAYSPLLVKPGITVVRSDHILANSILSNIELPGLPVGVVTTYLTQSVNSGAAGIAFASLATPDRDGRWVPDEKLAPTPAPPVKVFRPGGLRE